jgi:hypothetical protein
MAEYPEVGLLKTGYLEYWSNGKQIIWDGSDWDGSTITPRVLSGRLSRGRWIEDQHRQYAAIIAYRQSILDKIEDRSKALEKERRTAQRVLDSFASQYSVFRVEAER